jgi:hypothetical protein
MGALPEGAGPTPILLPFLNYPRSLEELAAEGRRC